MRVTSPQQKYLNDVFGLPDRDLERIRERMSEAQKEFMSISASEARLLQFIVRAFGVRKIVEFGTLFGYSALAMAKVLPADGVIITLENDETHHRFAAETFAASSDVSGKIVSLCGDAIETSRSIEARGPFDMVFIDANKTGYVEYLKWADRNVRKGGLIVGDNTFLWGGVWDQPSRVSIGDNQVRVMKEFNALLADPSKYNSTLIPTVEGLTIAQKL